MKDPYIRLDEKMLLLPDYDLAIISDVHISNEMSDRDVKFIENSILDTLNRNKITQLVFNGDTFTDFPFHKEGKAMIERLRTELNDVILLEGNHERSVGGLGDLQKTEKQHIELGDKEICIYHGDQEPEIDSDLYIIGHIHPTTRVDGSFKPCVLEHSGKGYKVIILPSYSKVRNIEYTEQRSTTPLLHNLSNSKVKKIF